jgi:DNA replication initiation complex subunit (GINS family)
MSDGIKMVKKSQYDQIFNVWKNERRSKDLLSVSGSLYSKIRQKIKTFEEQLEQLPEDDVFSFEIIKERKNRLERLFNDLVKIRTHKIIHSILRGVVPKEGLVIEELDFVSVLQEVLEAHHKRSLLGQTASCFTKTEKEEISGAKSSEEYMTIRILEDLPEILDVTAETESKRVFGPFKKEDIVRLPVIYAKTLIMKNAADQINLPQLEH